MNCTVAGCCLHNWHYTCTFVESVKMDGETWLRFRVYSAFGPYLKLVRASEFWG